MNGLYSISAFAEGDGLDGLEQVHEVDPDGPVADVPSIHGDALFVGGVAAAAGLPHAGDAGQNHAVLAEIDAVALDFFGDNWARADEAHVAADDVPELRQLVEAGLAQEGAELRDARVVLELKVRFPLLAGLGVLGKVFLQGFLCVWDHGLELIARKEPAIFADALVGEDDMALVVDGDDEEEGQQDGRYQDAAEYGEEDIEAALDKAVPLAGQVVLEREHQDLFAEEGLRLDAGHRGADEVWHEGDVPDVGLDLLDELLKGFFLEARRGDDDVLDAGVAHDGLGISHLAVKAELLRDALGDWMVVDDARHIVAVAEVILEEAQHALGRPAGTDQDDGPVEEMCFLQEEAHEVACEEDKAHDEDGEQYRVEARERDALLKEEEQDDAANRSVDDGAEDLANGVEQGLHLRVDLTPCQEYKEDQRHPDVDVGAWDPVDDRPVPEPECQILSGNDSRVIGQYEDERYEKACAFRFHLRTPRPDDSRHRIFASRAPLFINTFLISKEFVPLSSPNCPFYVILLSLYTGTLYLL